MLTTNDIRQSRGGCGARRGSALAVAALAASTLLTAPRTAHADEVSSGGKGIVGGALLGGEVVVFGEAIFGVRSTAAYLVGAGVGAAAGGVGGYFIEHSSTDGRVPTYLLAGGIALFIPAVVVGLDQTRYVPAEGAREDKPMRELPQSDPGKPGGSSVIGSEPPPATTPPSGTTPTPAPSGGGGGSPTPAPQSLFDVHEGELRLGMPVPAVRPIFSVAERKELGVKNPGTEFRFPVVHVTF